MQAETRANTPVVVLSSRWQELHGYMPESQEKQLQGAAVQFALLLTQLGIPGTVTIYSLNEVAWMPDQADTDTQQSQIAQLLQLADKPTVETISAALTSLFIQSHNGQQEQG